MSYKGRNRSRARRAISGLAAITSLLMAEIAIPRNLFADILRLIAELRPPPAAVSRGSA
jgi:hypothetical protein